MESYIKVTEFHFRKMNKLWRWTVVMVANNVDALSVFLAAHLQMVKMVIPMSKKKKKKLNLGVDNAPHRLSRSLLL